MHLYNHFPFRGVETSVAAFQEIGPRTRGGNVERETFTTQLCSHWGGMHGSSSLPWNN
jgi:hypothetical protein